MLSASVGHHLHHLAHLVELLYQPVYLLQVCSRTTCYTLSTACVEYLRILTLFWCHTLNNSFDALESVVINVDILNSLSNTGNHRCEVFQVTHFLYLVYLREKVFKVELILLYLLLQTSGFLFVILLLSSFHKRDNVAHTEYSVGHSRWVEHIDSLHFLACTYELYRLCDHSAYR